MEPGSNRTDHLLKFRFEDEEMGTAILEDKFEFWFGQPPVERNEDGSHFREGKKDFEVGGAIMEKDGDPISLLNSSV
jgi:hypothetical protein